MGAKIFTALGILLVLVVILYLSYICTKYVGQRVRGSGFGGSSRNIRVLEQRAFNQESSVALLQVSERIFLVGVTSHEVSLLTEIDDDSLLQDLSLSEEESPVPSFKDLLLKMKDRK